MSIGNAPFWGNYYGVSVKPGLWTGLDCGLDWTVDWTGLDWTGLTKTAVYRQRTPPRLQQLDPALPQVASYPFESSRHLVDF